MKKALFIFGTRPEAIKLAPLIYQFKNKSKKFEAIICVTAQHRRMLDQVLKVFNIKPDFDLDLMKENQSLFYTTAEALKKLEKVLTKVKPALVLVQGDTTTTFTTSLAAYYQKIKLAHVEAGLRTEDKFSPFPEEINRRLTDCLSDFLFAPTPKAKENLLREGIDESKIFITGNTVIDALFMTIEMQKDLKIQKDMEEQFINDYGISFEKRTILVTGHRRESFGKNLEEICHGIKLIAENSDVQVIYPVHLNPNVQKPVKSILKDLPNVYLIEPLDYFSFVWLMNKSYLILTDSGGIQEEAPSLGKPVLVMREKTERTEGISAGKARLVGTDREKIFSETIILLKDPIAYRAMSEAENPYGDGKASIRIREILEEKI
ncbi:MAG: non-hydrolyzing UDP-N-acetylglucosamine 2-epimerase [Candidatus Aminicenantia bacterium]